MPKYHGIKGALLLASTNAGAAASVGNLSQFTLSIENDTVDVSTIGDTHRTFVSGLKSASMSFSGLWADDIDIPFDAFDQSQTGGTVKAYLYPGGVAVARYWYGDVWPKSVGIEVGVGGAVTMSGEMQFNGTCTRVG